MVKLRDLNDYITCSLCKGYMVNATAISECMHTFCKGCIVKEFIKNSSCPQCGISVNPTEPTKTLKSDNQLQDLINKVVPGFAETERASRKQFYASRGEREEADTVEPIESTFLTPKKRALYRQAGLPVYVMLQHERNTAASTMRIKRYPGHMIRFPSDLTVLHLKEFIRQRLSLGFDVPQFDDAKSQKAWERTRVLAIQNAPDVDILYGDYLLDEDVTLGLLSRIKLGLVKQAVLALTYRFRGTLKSSAEKEAPTEDVSLSLTLTQPAPSSHVTCLTRGRGKGKTAARSVKRTPGVIGKVRTGPGAYAAPAPKTGAPLAPRHVIINKPASGRKPVVFTKSPVVKKSIIIQNSSKPPLTIPHSTIPQGLVKHPSRVILPIKPYNGGPKRNTIVIQQPSSAQKRGQDGRPKGSVVKLQRAVRPR
ncbi:polycomb group RING finger protein 6-like [Bolinopsis microptera]|uniref:polycomb group RING finger protein 6-like n=1 Tax=Bolinopsis microptera TaxID=2820187 RepID=UPI00307A076F